MGAVDAVDNRHLGLNFMEVVEPGKIEVDIDAINSFLLHCRINLAPGHRSRTGAQGFQRGDMRLAGSGTDFQALHIFHFFHRPLVVVDVAEADLDVAQPQYIVLFQSAGHLFAHRSIGDLVG